MLQCSATSIAPAYSQWPTGIGRGDHRLDDRCGRSFAPGYRRPSRGAAGSRRDGAQRFRDDPFGNPVLSVTLWPTRLMDRGELSMDAASELVRRLGREALHQRAGRVARYVGLQNDEAAVFRELAEEAARKPSPSTTSGRWWGGRAAAVFTAHPTLAWRGGSAMRSPTLFPAPRPEELFDPAYRIN